MVTLGGQITSPAEVPGGLPTRAQMMRLVWIDAALDLGVVLRRADLCRDLGVSIPTASADLAEFARLFPGRLSYDSSRKGYVPVEGSGPRYPGWVRAAVMEVVSALAVAELSVAVANAGRRRAARRAEVT